MTDSALFRLAGVAAFYAAYLVTSFILGEGAFGPATYFWHQGIVVAGTVAALTWAGLRRPQPLRGFLIASAASSGFLLVTTLSYEQQLTLGGSGITLSNAAYLIFLFGWICSWSHLNLHLARQQPPSRQTVTLFLILMAGFLVLFAGFYAPVYQDILSTLAGRAHVAIAVLELGGVVAGLAAILLGTPSALVLQVFGITLLAASDMLYTEATFAAAGVAGAEPLWMLGLCLIFAGAVVLPSPAKEGGDHAASLAALAQRSRRSGLSTVLLALSLGAVLLSAVVTLGLEYAFHDATDAASAGRALFVVLFVVLLVVIMVRLTSHFDQAVRFVGSYSQALLRGRLRGEDWRGGQGRLAWILDATGLGTYLDSLRQAAGRLRQDVLFLGPERLYRTAAEPDEDGEPECFIVMPFGLEDSDEVHSILRRACREAGVRPVRGDDLFTPTDILDDIWRGISGARFIIADITGRNPNVLYELGMAHTLAKPVLILSRNADDIPIDLSTRRVILYGTGGDSDWRAALAAKTAAAIQALLGELSDEARSGDRP